VRLLVQVGDRTVCAASPDVPGWMLLASSPQQLWQQLGEAASMAARRAAFLTSRGEQVDTCETCGTPSGLDAFMPPAALASVTPLPTPGGRTATCVDCRDVFPIKPRGRAPRRCPECRTTPRPARPEGVAP
jgi:hypothetical protein